MENVLPSFHRPHRPVWRTVVLPKEHGSWSLALEPLAFGLMAAPSLAGAALAVTVVAGFLARRPLRFAVSDERPERRAVARQSVGILFAIAGAGMSTAMVLGGWQWLMWLLPAALAGGVFLSLDLRNEGRSELAEISGSAAFALMPAALASLAGQNPLSAAGLALVMLGRAVPTVVCIRAALRASKTGRFEMAPALASAGLALGVGAVLAYRGIAPWAAPVALGVLLLRTTLWLVFPRPPLRGRTLGMIEAALGLAFVFGVAACWPA